MLAQDKFARANAVLGKRNKNCRSPGGAARVGRCWDVETLRPQGQKPSGL